MARTWRWTRWSETAGCNESMSPDHPAKSFPLGERGDGRICLAGASPTGQNNLWLMIALKAIEQDTHYLHRRLMTISWVSQISQISRSLRDLFPDLAPDLASFDAD
jgi:hypothetical protein